MFNVVLNHLCVCGVRRDSERTCRLFLPVCWQQACLLVASECCYGCVTVDSKANAALTECVTSCSGVDWQVKMLKWFLLPLPPSHHVAASQCVMLLFAWNLFSFGEVWLLCVFLIYWPIVPSADINQLLKCSRRLWKESSLAQKPRRFFSHETKHYPQFSCCLLTLN